MKLELIGPTDVWRRNPKNTVPTLKHGDGSAVGMLQFVFNWESCHSGRIHEERMICENKANPFVFQHDNNTKHTLLLVKNYPQKTKVSVTDKALKVCGVNCRPR